MSKMKTKVLALSLLLACSAANAQNDTLLFRDFNTDPSVYIQFAILPSGTTSDTSWYSYDLDGLPDGSPQGTRPGEWFWSQAFCPSDTLTQVNCLASNSWTNDPVTPVNNWVVLPSLHIIDANATLHWKAAPRQTPRYVDSYRILVSGTTNDITGGVFTDTIFVAAQFAALNNQSLPNQYASYSFAPAPTSNPMAPFVHGIDLTYTEFNTASDSSRLYGRLRPFSVSLAQYAGQHIYIAFLHESTDDNLISIDDVLVMGTDPNSIAENKLDLGLSVYPNPVASDVINVKFEQAVAGNVSAELFDMAGQLVRTTAFGNTGTGMQSHTVPVNGLAAGMYHLQLHTAQGTAHTRVVIR